MLCRICELECEEKIGALKINKEIVLEDFHFYYCNNCGKEYLGEEDTERMEKIIMEYLSK